MGHEDAGAVPAEADRLHEATERLETIDRRVQLRAHPDFPQTEGHVGERRRDDGPGKIAERARFIEVHASEQIRHPPDQAHLEDRGTAIVGAEIIRQG